MSPRTHKLRMTRKRRPLLLVVLAISRPGNGDSTFHKLFLQQPAVAGSGFCRRAREMVTTLMCKCPIARHQIYKLRAQVVDLSEGLWARLSAVSSWGPYWELLYPRFAALLWRGFSVKSERTVSNLRIEPRDTALRPIVYFSLIEDCSFIWNSPFRARWPILGNF